jgi:hypothetical protein
MSYGKKARPKLYEAVVFWLKSLFKIKNEGPAHESRADDAPAAVAAPTTGTGPVWVVIMEDVFKSMCKVVGAPWQWQRVLDDHNGPGPRSSRRPRPRAGQW